MENDIAIYSEGEFKTKYNILYHQCRIMVSGIPGDWVFGQYRINTYERTRTSHFISYEDMDDEDRSFTIEWDNVDTPFSKAHIEIAND